MNFTSHGTTTVAVNILAKPEEFSADPDIHRRRPVVSLTRVYRILSLAVFARGESLVIAECSWVSGSKCKPVLDCPELEFSATGT
jgi:hypothetical protein